MMGKQGDNNIEAADIQTQKGFLPSFSPSKSEISVKFSLPATTLHILDNLFESIPAIFRIEDSPTYRSAWIKKFGTEVLKKEVEEYSKKFSIIRKKYQKFPKSLDGIMDDNNGLFAPNPKEVIDPMMDIFCAKDTFSEVFDALAPILSQSELDYLKKVFAYFEEKVKILIGDLKPYLELVSNISLMLEKTSASQHLNQIKQFYGSNTLGPKSRIFVWSPGNCSGICYGENNIFRVPERSFQDKDKSESYQHTVLMIASVVIHEATHYISGNMPYLKKQALTQAFKDHKRLGDKPHFFDELEEPLVLATQRLFIKRHSDVNKSWFNDPLAIHFQSLLEEHLQAYPILNIAFIEKCAKAKIAPPKSQI